jgi:Flp pilus assembly protein TadG
VTTNHLRRRQARGAATVEFAAVAPLLVTLLIGAWEVGCMVETQQVLDNAVREGGRQASTARKTAAQVQQDVLNYITLRGFSTAGATVTVTNLTSSARSDPTAANQMDHFRVTLTYPFANVRWVLLSSITNITTLSASSDWYSMVDLPVTVSNTIPVQ